MLRDLVRDKLAAYPGEYLWPGSGGGIPRSDPGFAAYRDAAVADTQRRLASTQQRLRTPSDPSLLSIKSWQYGFTGAAADDAAARSFADALYLQLQAYQDDWLGSSSWQTYLDCLDHPDRWTAVACALARDGSTVEANTCLAAARWLAPDAVDEATAGLTRGPGLPKRLTDQPAADFPGLPFHKRHWRAWDMKNYGRLDLPTLLRWECDRNFSVRTRIYRSLGQRPHPTAIQALHEGTLDPHPFARAQAARSLGWCVDPTALARLHALADDSDPEVRRSAAKASQRIRGWWSFYGEWNEIAGSPARARSVARQLADDGLRAFAFEVAVGFGEDEALVDLLEPDALAGDWDDDTRSYSHWFSEAAAVEAASDEDSLTTAVAECGRTDASGFVARQLLRRRGLGKPAQRRLHPV